MAKQAAGGTPATLALTRAGIPFTVRVYDHDHDHDPRGSFGLEAAEALDADPDRVFKTLLVAVDRKLVVGIVPVSGQLDLKAVAAAAGGKRATMAEPRTAERASGYVVGGISPVGQRRRHPTVLDHSALKHPTIFVSGGKRGLELELEPADLIAVTGATTAAIGRTA